MSDFAQAVGKMEIPTLKGCLNDVGFLIVERKGEEKEQYCPFSTDLQGEEPADAHCGDWCAHFGEPYLVDKNNPMAPMLPHLIGKTILEICHEKKLIFSELKDVRRP